MAGMLQNTVTFELRFKSCCPSKDRGNAAGRSSLTGSVCQSGNYVCSAMPTRHPCQSPRSVKGSDLWPDRSGRSQEGRKEFDVGGTGFPCYAGLFRVGPTQGCRCANTQVEGDSRGPGRNHTHTPCHCQLPRIHQDRGMTHLHQLHENSCKKNAITPNLK